MMLNVVKNEYFQSPSKTKHSKLKKSLEATKVEPATESYSHRYVTDDSV